MNNTDFLEKNKLVYESLRYFSLINNVLYSNYNGNYQIPLIHTNLANLNPNLFLLTPDEIFRIIYVLELLPKSELNNYEINYIKEYVKRYLDVNDMVLENQNIDPNLAFCLSIPIYTSYDEAFSSYPASMLIQSIVNNHTLEIDSGKSKHAKLVLTNKQFAPISEAENLEAIEKAGFTALVLIILTIALTSLYVTIFVVNH